MWSTRLKNSVRRHHLISGAEPLVDRLKSLPPSSDLEQIGFIGPEKGGNVFFDLDGEEFIGLVISDRPFRC